MAAEIQPSQATPTLPSNRKSKPRNSKKPYKNPKCSAKKSQNPTHKTQKLYRKHAKNYYSSNEEEVFEEAHTKPATAGSPEDPAASSGNDEEVAVDTDAQSDDELDEDGPYQGMTKLAEGSRAFKLTFSKIMKKKLPNEPLVQCCRRTSVVGAQESGCGEARGGGDGVKGEGGDKKTEAVQLVCRQRDQ